MRSNHLVISPLLLLGTARRGGLGRQCLLESLLMRPLDSTSMCDSQALWSLFWVGPGASYCTGSGTCSACSLTLPLLQNSKRLGQFSAILPSGALSASGVEAEVRGEHIHQRLHGILDQGWSGGEEDGAGLRMALGFSEVRGGSGEPQASKASCKAPFLVAGAKHGLVSTGPSIIPEALCSKSRGKGSECPKAPWHQRTGSIPTRDRSLS